ncbi:hypothetical protein LIPSTDRAFT_160801 [Lipomyces starkeyi NRRL Y-11557]|uniref:DDE-1 domain-containing protein n=1 Tax=Lipomyces starkeyi NRRL Y-11557 TaxID=675824 RepID=A0A1E3PZQ6_LIPST|nr:hypothetical protein LIPSTDRAFT_160801 [Lipomyces starkeyi NRRL Y-11557]
MAEGICTRRVEVVSRPNDKGTYSRQLDSARHNEATSDKITAWFDAFQIRFQEQKCELCDIYNMDETGFAVDDTQSTLYNCRFYSESKLESYCREARVGNCVGMSRRSLPTTNGYFTNSHGSPRINFPNGGYQRFLAAGHRNRNGYERLRKVFGPESRKKSKNRARLLIMDGHARNMRE